MAALDHPAPSPEVGVSPLGLDLLTSSAQVQGELVRGRYLADLGVVVAPVQAEALRGLCRGLRSLDRDRVDRPLQELVVVAVGARRGEPDRDSRCLGEERALRPFLALSVGLGPVPSPPQGALC